MLVNAHTRRSRTNTRRRRARTRVRIRTRHARTRDVHATHAREHTHDGHVRMRARTHALVHAVVEGESVVIKWLPRFNEFQLPNKQRFVTGECKTRTFSLPTQTVVEDSNVEFLRITKAVFTLGPVLFRILATRTRQVDLASDLHSHYKRLTRRERYAPTSPCTHCVCFVTVVTQLHVLNSWHNVTFPGHVNCISGNK